jgi:IS30 family transposase
MTAELIAKKLGCSVTPITGCLKRNGIKLRSTRDSILGFKLDEKKVIDLYVNKKMSLSLIAKKLGCSATTITRCLKRNGIKLRPYSESVLGFKLDEKKVINLYIEKKMSPGSIAKKLGCSVTTITGCLKRNGIKLRSLSEAHLGFKLDEKKVIDLYVNKKMTPGSIAKKFGCSKQPIYSCLKRNGIDRRSPSEAYLVRRKP